jgi:hypothetical protein
MLGERREHLHACPSEYRKNVAHPTNTHYDLKSMI